jgi:DNA-binding GntR family transcriptional regulator
MSAIPAPTGTPSLSSSIHAIERPVLHNTVTEKLRQMIVEGTLPAGYRLNERALCTTLGVSRTPLREALKVLAAEGLIEHQPNRGAVVAVMSEQDIFDTFELLSALEALSGELACARITAAELAELETLQGRMLACFQQGDLPGYYAINHAIHDKINEAGRNGALRQTYITVNRRVQALRFRSNFDKEKWQRAMAEHEQMLAALQARDAPRLAVLLRDHLLAKRAAVLGVLQQQRQHQAELSAS